MRQLFCITVLISVSLLYAVNCMPLLTTMTGEFSGASLGRSMCSIDFNGDGIQDLVALEKNWNPDGVLDYSYRMFGRINFYWGGYGFDNNLDFSIPGTYQRQYGLGYLRNAGDVNNDGIEDLCYFGSESGQEKICIFYGNHIPVTTPDIVIAFSHSIASFIGSLWALGDVNNDGHAEIGYVLVNSDYSTATMRIFDGSSHNSVILYSLQWGAMASSLTGIGDINNDGIDDYLSSHSLTQHENTHSRITVHFGSNEFPTSDSLTICSDTNTVIDPWTGPLGDVNGDGIDDFVGLIDGSGYKIWCGNSDISAYWNTEFSQYISRTDDGYTLIHGDFNGDGYSDIATSNSNYAGADGRAYIWMGGLNLNGGVDLELPAPPGVSEQFGKAKAAGDFNNDGYCDLAVSQPFSDPAPLWTSGKIHIYLGNAELADTTVGVQDDCVALTSNSNIWDINIYPNPISQIETTVNIFFIGSGYGKERNLSIEIYNIKGQKLSAHKFNGTLVESKNWSGLLNNTAPGVYFAKICSGDKTLVTKRFTII
ncbi:MAG: T9SS type A sorting domain-containing protein [Candidatus Cloacimonadaceae bacterium]|nr:T9SS type A sorting domain-containing protein [Candidatus Cloacimonadota bacterium]